MPLCNLQGWQCERVVQRDGLSGKILLVLPTDSAAHLKKVRRASSKGRPLWFAHKVPSESRWVPSQVKEIALLLEEQLGLVKGWLLATPCKVGCAFNTPVCRHHMLGGLVFTAGWREH